MQFEVIISERAQQMLGEHMRFLAQASIDAARGTQSSILSAIRSLAIMPGRYPFFNHPLIPANKYHKLFVKKWYLILYQIKDHCVFVDYILDYREHPLNALLSSGE